ncbi:MAG: hypothetical protein DRQ58_10030, partial [Gammaproteobacteria bacterium]
MSTRKIVIGSLAAVGLLVLTFLNLEVDVHMKDVSAKPSPNRDVYYPGTEELAADEMRVIACGSGMPMPRLKQAAACFLIE